MRYFFFAAVYLFSFYLSATGYEATNFSCRGDGQQFILKITSDTRDIKFLSLIANETVWLARSITRNDNLYTLDVFHPTSIASGSPTQEYDLNQISFVLPRAMVRAVQTGGYYIPEITYYSANFTMIINARFADQSERKFDVSCVGNL